MKQVYKNRTFFFIEDKEGTRVISFNDGKHLNLVQGSNGCLSGQHGCYNALGKPGNYLKAPQLEGGDPHGWLIRLIHSNK